MSPKDRVVVSGYALAVREMRAKFPKHWKRLRAELDQAHKKVLALPH